MKKRVALLLAVTLAAALLCVPVHAADSLPPGGVFAKSNLVAWCIVPFDAQKRNPHQRAELLAQLGIRRFAYDWRAEHVPSFEEEIVEIQKHGIQYFAFWGFHPAIAPLLPKHHVTPQLWITVPSPPGADDAARADAAARQLQGMVDKSRALGCKLGLYNHGSWGGEPAHMLAVLQRLRQGGCADHVGIVYNFHHGHGHIHDFPQVLAAMLPHLLCLNLNGMNDNAQPMILPIGAGQHEQAMMEAVKRSGYAGPIGILGHRAEVDAAVSLRQNLDGLKSVLQRMGDEAAWKTYQ